MHNVPATEKCKVVAWQHSRCKMVNWLFTLGFPVQTNTDGSFLVVFEVVYVV